MGISLTLSNVTLRLLFSTCRQRWLLSTLARCEIPSQLLVALPTALHTWTLARLPRLRMVMHTRWMSSSIIRSSVRHSMHCRSTDMYTDAEGALRTWINESADAASVRAAAPKGAQLKRLRSPFQGAYILLRRIGGTPSLAEGMYDRARLSATVYGISKEGSETAARAYANAIAQVRTATTMG